MEKISKTIGTMIVLFCIRATKTIFVMPRGTCRFYPSCSEYAEQALATLPFYRAFFCIVKRLAKCHPFAGSAGYDPVPNPTERRHCRE